MGERVGHADLIQGTIGLQLGGQTATELIVFQNKESLDRFKAQKVQFAANATAVIVEQGATATKKHEYKDGIAVFLSPKVGAMFEAAVGGQSFLYKPIAGAEPSTTRPTTAATQTSATQSTTQPAK
jgi:lipid-binding SYLF domain-containing protein